MRMAARHQNLNLYVKLIFSAPGPKQSLLLIDLPECKVSLFELALTFVSYFYNFCWPQTDF